MSDEVVIAGAAIDEAYAHESAATRRKFVAGAAGLMGSMACSAWPAHEFHYQTLTSRAVGGKSLTTKFWIPDAVFASPEGLLGTLVVGDQRLVNAYLLGATVFARPGGNAAARLSRIASEFMAVEMVHRALALQSLGKLGNDRAFAKFSQVEEVEGLPTSGQPGFKNILTAVEILKSAGIGFGEEGTVKQGAFYELSDFIAQVPNPSDVNTRNPA